MVEKDNSSDISNFRVAVESGPAKNSSMCLGEGAQFSWFEDLSWIAPAYSSSAKSFLKKSSVVKTAASALRCLASSVRREEYRFGCSHVRK